MRLHRLGIIPVCAGEPFPHLPPLRSWVVYAEPNNLAKYSVGSSPFAGRGREGYVAVGYVEEGNQIQVGVTPSS